MYEILKHINDTVALGYKDGKVYILKKILPDETQIYKKIMLLNCEYLEKIFDLTVIGTDFFAVCEYISGYTLEQVLARRGPLDDRETKRIAVCVCEGLEALHSVGIVHRDVTPKNVMLTEDGKVRIIDFGISRFKKENASADTCMLGTCGYAAPEQYGFGQSTEKADIYAVGVLINYLKTGALPAEKAAAGEFGAIIKKCTRMEPDKRYHDMRALISALNGRTGVWKVIRFIPGFGKGILYREILSVTYYIAVLIVGIAFFTAESTGGEYPQLRTDMFYICFFVLPIPILGNAGLWSEKWKYTRNKSKKDQLLIRLVTTVCFLFICSCFLFLL